MSSNPGEEWSSSKIKKSGWPKKSGFWSNNNWSPGRMGKMGWNWKYTDWSLADDED